MEPSSMTMRNASPADSAPLRVSDTDVPKGMGAWLTEK
jgi:hypothetical protein